MSKEWLNTAHGDGAAARSAVESLHSLEIYTTTDSVQLSDLSTYTVYEITGADASDFLQGQFCNDLATVTPMQAQLTGYCTPKGRLLALPTILGFEQGYRLLLPEDVADAFIKRLTMFIMRSDVTVRRLDDWVALGITSDSAGAIGPLSEMLGALPVGEMSVSSNDQSQLIRWHDCHSSGKPRTRYLKLAAEDQQLAIWNAVNSDARHSASTWRLADISAGIPSIRHGVVDAFVPQMVNLQLINALSFTKGCYPGQEIVARMQYLGKLKRHMRVFRTVLDSQSVDADEFLKPGTALIAGTDENAGVIVDAMPMSGTSALILAVTRVAADDDAFHVGGCALESLDMPYELPSLDVA